MPNRNAEKDPKTTPLGSSPSVPLEIWALVGEKIHSRTTLRALVLVCRAFRDVFTSTLHAKRSVILSHCPAETLRSLRRSLPDFLKHTKRFEVIFAEFCEGGIHYKIEDNYEYAAFLARMLREMNNLQSFRWLDGSFENSYGLAKILKDTRVTTAFKSCKSLKEISIQFSTQYLNNRQAASNCWMPMDCFQNLRSLELFGFYAVPNKSQLVRDVAGVLRRSPGLKKLGLGMACDFDCMQLPESMIKEGDDHFLAELCMLYHSKADTSPLALETLRLGTGMYLSQPSQATTKNNFLSKLVSLAELETLHIFNGFIKHETEEAELETTVIDWSLLDGCGSLHQLFVSRLEPDVTDWLNTKGQSVQELMTTHQYTMYDESLDEFDCLELPKLTMLLISEEKVDTRDDDDEVWSDTESSDDNASDAMELDNSDADYDSEEFDSSIASSSEEYSRNHDRSVITVLDRLHDGGAQLTRLRIDLDFESQWLHFYNKLFNLSSLTQLHLCAYPKMSAMWPNVAKSEDIARHYAQFVLSRCPRLQFIRIHYWAWRVCLMTDASSREGGHKELVALDIDEILSIDLFALDHFAYQSGLTGHVEPSDLVPLDGKTFTLPPELMDAEGNFGYNGMTGDAAVEAFLAANPPPAS